MDYKEGIEEYIDADLITLKKIKLQKKTLNQILKKMVEVREDGGTIYIMGNGGSSSTASHMAEDLVKTANKDNSKRFRAICLSDNVPTVLAWANDYGYEYIFEEQLKNFLTKKDLVIGISGSGNSKNILRAIEFANKFGAFTVGLTGMGGGKLAKLATLAFIVPDESMYRTEDMHLLLNHLFVFALLHSD